MNVLLDGFPRTVDIDGSEWEINTGFRTSILFEIMMQDESLTNMEKVAEALTLYYPVCPPDLYGAVEGIRWFYMIGEAKDATENAGEGGAEENTEAAESETETGGAVYSYEYDAPYIYAAFLEQYGIDLAEADMHWWKFKALFQSISNRTKFGKIMEIRSTKIDGSMSKEQKNYYRRMKKLYALPLSRGEAERQDAIYEALMQGKDVSGLL